MSDYGHGVRGKEKGGVVIPYGEHGGRQGGDRIAQEFGKKAKTRQVL